MATEKSQKIDFLYNHLTLHSDWLKSNQSFKEELGKLTLNIISKIIEYIEVFDQHMRIRPLMKYRKFYLKSTRKEHYSRELNNIVFPDMETDNVKVFKRMSSKANNLLLCVLYERLGFSIFDIPDVFEPKYVPNKHSSYKCISSDSTDNVRLSCRRQKKHENFPNDLHKDGNSEESSFGKCVLNKRDRCNINPLFKLSKQS